MDSLCGYFFQRTFEIQATFVEIYNECIQDLLNKASPIDHIKFALKRTVRTPKEVMKYLTEGTHSRATGSTKMYHIPFLMPYIYLCKRANDFVYVGNRYFLTCGKSIQEQRIFTFARNFHPMAHTKAKGRLVFHSLDTTFLMQN